MCFFFKQKTAYEMRISDWSSDVCSSDLLIIPTIATGIWQNPDVVAKLCAALRHLTGDQWSFDFKAAGNKAPIGERQIPLGFANSKKFARSEEHTSELQSLMRISYAVFCLKNTNNASNTNKFYHTHAQKHTVNR